MKFKFGLLALLAILISCSKSPTQPATNNNTKDQRFIGTWIGLVDGHYDTLTLHMDGYLFIEHSFWITYLYPGEDTTGYSIYKTVGDWNNTNDSLLLNPVTEVNYDSTYNTIFNIGIYNGSYVNHTHYQYLFNTASEIWLWRNQIKRIFTRIK
jgi:hypothetical protein